MHINVQYISMVQNQPFLTVVLCLDKGKFNYFCMSRKDVFGFKCLPMIC